MFGVQPSILKEDYAKWMLEDPRVNFAISKRGAKPGLDHLGVQVESSDELTALREQVREAEIAVLDQGNAACCYARSDKYWVTDPQGIAWETFHTLDSVPVFGEDNRVAPSRRRRVSACCAPAPKAVPSRDSTGEQTRLLRLGANSRFEIDRGPPSLQRPFSVHRQFGAQHPGRGYLNATGRGRFRAFSARAATRRVQSTRSQ